MSANCAHSGGAASEFIIGPRFARTRWPRLEGCGPYCGLMVRDGGAVKYTQTAQTCLRAPPHHEERGRIRPYPLTRSTRATTALARNWAIIALRCLRS